MTQICKEIMHACCRVIYHIWIHVKIISNETGDIFLELISRYTWIPARSTVRSVNRKPPPVYFPIIDIFRLTGSRSPKTDSSIERKPHIFHRKQWLQKTVETQINFVRNFVDFKDNNRFQKVREPCKNAACDTISWFAKTHIANTREFDVSLQP